MHPACKRSHRTRDAVAMAVSGRVGAFRGRSISLRRLLVLAFTLLSLDARAVTIDWVLIGEPGNPPDTLTNCFAPECGSVPYAYRISRTEVTVAHYVEFLNGVDPNGLNARGLYSPLMSSDPLNGGVLFDGARPAGSKYRVKSGFANKPEVYCSFWDAMRFANWMNNGQGNASTEAGTYTLTAEGISANSITRNPGAVVSLPSENEWYKAAYHVSGSVYYDYPASTDAVMVCSAPTSEPNHANCDSVVGSVVDVGSYSGSASPWGTFDQGGNAWEWNEQIVGTDRGRRGGPWIHPIEYAAASYPNYHPPDYESYTTGIRLVSAVNACSNGIDDDGDGLVDFPADPGCQASTSTLENPACDDRIDDDGDGLLDFPADPGCKAVYSSLENPACDDGVDNDLDGAIDWDGGPAMGTPDPQCSAAYRDSEARTCGLGVELALLLPLVWRATRRARGVR